MAKRARRPKSVPAARKPPATVSRAQDSPAPDKPDKPGKGGQSANAARQELKAQKQLQRRQAVAAELEQKPGPKTTDGKDLTSRLNALEKQYRDVGRDLSRSPRIDNENALRRQVTLFTPSGRQVSLTLGRRLSADEDLEQFTRLIDQVESQ